MTIFVYNHRYFKTVDSIIIFYVSLSYLRFSGKIPEGEIDCDGDNQGNEGQGVSCNIIVTI